MKKREPLLLCAIEYLGFRLLMALYGCIPARKAYDWGAGLSSRLYPLFRRRRKIAVSNILRTGVAQTREEADRIARKAFGHFVGHLCEAVKVPQVVKPDNWRECLEFEGAEETRRLLFDSPESPVIILSGHHGVWEAAATVLSYAKPIIAVARDMNNPYINGYLKKHHFRGGITVISKKQGFTPRIMEEWRRNGAALTLIMDQRAGRKQGIRVPFMGIPSSTHTSPARLHLKTGVPLLIGSFIRVAPFRYKIYTGTPLRFKPTGDRKADFTEILTEVNRRLEENIRRNPEQYLWAHNRWKE